MEIMNNKRAMVNYVIELEDIDPMEYILNCTKFVTGLSLIYMYLFYNVL